MSPAEIQVMINVASSMGKIYNSFQIPPFSISYQRFQVFLFPFNFYVEGTMGAVVILSGSRMGEDNGSYFNLSSFIFV